jgi:cellulase-like Ig domain-containing protein
MPSNSAYRPGIRSSATAAATGITATALLAALSLTGGAGTAQAATTGLVRVSQLGYTDSGAKEAFLLAKSAVSGASWKLVDSSGATAASGTTGTGLGGWNSAYPAVYLIDFTSVKTDGRYHLVVSGAAAGTSPPFTIGGASAVFAKPARHRLLPGAARRRRRRPGTARPQALAPERHQGHRLQHTHLHLLRRRHHQRSPGEDRRHGRRLGRLVRRR